MPTRNQIRVLESIGESAENEKTAAASLGKSEDNTRMTVTAVYKEFQADLDLVIRFFPVFEHRFKLTERHAKKGEDGTYTKLRRLARLIKQEKG